MSELSSDCQTAPVFATDLKKGGKGGKGGASAPAFWKTTPFATFPGLPLPGFENCRCAAAPAASVDGPQDAGCLGVVQCVVPQPVVLPTAHVGKPVRSKRQVAICVETRGDPQGIR